MLLTLNDVNVMDKKINKSWEGSTEQFVDMAKAYAYAKDLISYDQEPNVRLVRDYVSRGIVSKPRKEGKEVIFGYRHLIEFLACRALINDGWPLKKIASDFQKSTIEELKLFVPGETPENDSTKLIRKFTRKPSQFNELEIEPLASKEIAPQDANSTKISDANSSLIGLWDRIPDEGKKSFRKLIGDNPSPTSIGKRFDHDDKEDSNFLKKALEALEKNKVIKKPKIVSFNFKNEVAVDAYSFSEVFINGVMRMRLDLFIVADIADQQEEKVDPWKYLHMLQRFIKKSKNMEETFFVTVNDLTLDLIYLIQNQDIDFIGLFFLTNGQWNRTKKSYRERIEGIPSGIQIWDHKRLFGYYPTNVKLKKQITSETFERLRNRANEVTELNQLAKLLGNTSSGFNTEEFTKLNITKSINLQIGPSEMKSMTRERAKAIARAIELNLILKKNREEKTDD